MCIPKETWLITGITGHCGSVLARLLLNKNIRVVGIVRRLSTPNIWRIENIKNSLELVEADLTDFGSLLVVLRDISPSHVVNMASQSFVPTSFQQPLLTFDVTAAGVIRLLEAIRQTDRNIRFYQSSSSECFGKVQETPQSETTSFYPRSPYGVAKTAAFWTTINYREAYNMFCSNGIMFNCEGPGRGEEFVTRKISMGVAKIKMGQADKLELGNLEAQRDWGDVTDYMDAVIQILSYSEPDDFVIATGIMHSVKEFCKAAFEYVGLDWQNYVQINKRFCRPSEVDVLVGNITKIRETLGWKPKVTFLELVKKMVEIDLKVMETEKNGKNNRTAYRRTFNS